MTFLAIGREDLFAAVARRKFRRGLCALWSSNFFHRGHFTAVWIKRFATKIPGESAEVSAAKKYREPVHCDQPDGKRFTTDARLAFFALHRGMDVLDVSDFAVIHALAGLRLWCWCVL